MYKLVRNLSTIGKLLKPSGHTKKIYSKKLFGTVYWKAKGKTRRGERRQTILISIYIYFPLQDPIKLKNSYNGLDHNEILNEIYILLHGSLESLSMS